MSFRTDVAGYITGVRFYKGASNTGTHTGNLWTRTGTLLATRHVHRRDRRRGWQQVTFATPVAISADTTYVASYHAPIGRYAVNRNYFADRRTHRPPPAPPRPTQQRRLPLRHRRRFPTASFQPATTGSTSLFDSFLSQHSAG